MKTIVTDTTLVDLLLVSKTLPQDEINQIEAFTGRNYDPESVAVSLYVADNMKWTCRVRETGEPLAVAGYSQVGATVWRSFMLASDTAWAEYGKEVTEHTADVIRKLVENNPYIRLETVCLASRKLAQRWYKRIGLEFESTLRGYGVKGEDAVLYTKVNETGEKRIITVNGSKARQ